MQHSKGNCSSKVCIGQMSTTSRSSEPEVNLSLTLTSAPAGQSHVEVSKTEEKGVRLIQLLLTCAHHASSGNLHHAEACLRQISPLASVSGDPIQRLAARFAYALATRLVKLWPGLYKALNHTPPSKPKMDRALASFSQAFPYLSFAYSIVTRTLVHAMSEERVIHIVDLGCAESRLWVSLMQNLVMKGHGQPHLRITCVSTNKIALEKLGKRLIKEAESLDMPFQFNPVNASLRELTTDMLKIRSGEALALVSILSLHVLLNEDDRVDASFGFGGNKGNGVKDCKQMGQFLAMARSMSPKVFLLVEQEADHNLNRLGDRFVEGLHYYSAVFDSLDVHQGCLSCEERLAIEEMFGREIEDIVACEGLEREERHERHARWMVRFGRGGFRPVRLWCDGKQMVEASGKDGYKIRNDKACIMICWHERPLYAVSAWISQ